MAIGFAFSSVMTTWREVTPRSVAGQLQLTMTILPSAAAVTVGSGRGPDGTPDPGADAGEHTAESSNPVAALHTRTCTR